MSLFSTGKVEARPDFSKPIPAGRYLMNIDEMTQEVSKGGNPYIKVTFVILGSKSEDEEIDFFQKDRKHWENFLPLEGWSLTLFGQLAIALGYDYTVNEDTGGNDIDVDELAEECGATSWDELEPFLIADMLERASVRGGLWITLGVGADKSARKQGKVGAMKNFTNAYELATEEEIEDFLYADAME